MILPVNKSYQLTLIDSMILFNGSYEQNITIILEILNFTVDDYGFNQVGTEMIR